MFHADWILAQAGPLPDPARERRPTLLRRAQLGRPITPAWPVTGELRGLPGRYPGEGSQLDWGRAEVKLLPTLRKPGTTAWAAALATIDQPTVAIPLADTRRTVRLIRAFKCDGGITLIVSIDLQRLDRGRHRPTSGALGNVAILSAPPEVAEERLRETLEEAYLLMDPNFRDRVLRADDLTEPVVVVVAERDVINDAAAVAATFGMTIEPLADNIARDQPRLARVVESLGPLLAAAFLWEDRTDNLVWVGDLIASLTRPDLPRVRLADSAGPLLRAEMRRALMEISAGTFEPEDEVTVDTCARCQPTVSRAISENDLRVGTVATRSSGGCVCGGSYSESQSIRLSLAVQLAGLENLLIIGYQDNFDSVAAAVNGADVRHIKSAGDAVAAAERAELAIIVTGSAMGHSDAQPYVDAVNARAVPLARTSSSQMSDVIRAVFEEAIRRTPQLSRARPSELED